MERETSPQATSHHAGEPRRQDTGTPPWERAATKQVPFADAGTANELSAAERHALPALWTARSNSVSGRDATKKEPSPKQHSRKYHSISEGSPVEPHGQHWSAGQPAPYETPLDFAPTMSTAASRSGLVSPVRIPGGPAPPLTPPDSTRGKSLDHTDANSDEDHSGIRVLPGTMSTRPTTKSHGSRQTKSDDATEPARQADKFGKRMRSALSGIFKKRTSNEEDFVRIGDKHWTEE